ncbi:hypothetical protein SAY87_000536 [Trapa incisa]|uniref:Uncharacterized protein n=1 Tax=Trapa incisa TaxID=236973 RepID=A0AAN7GBV0_9MYRT|nr:hypothetical protein SAY87_000536 [Trapa incisa]
MAPHFSSIFMRSSSRTACGRTVYCFALQPTKYQRKEEKKSENVINLVISVSTCMRKRSREGDGEPQTAMKVEEKETELTLSCPATKSESQPSLEIKRPALFPLFSSTHNGKTSRTRESRLF